MAAATIVPVEEYLRSSYVPDVEYLDAHLVGRNVGEWRHGRLQGLVFAVSPHPARYRVPDVCVVALPYPPEPVLTKPPHLAIEITSPDDRIADILEKVAEYLKAGIPHVWLPDPYRHVLQVAENDDFRAVPDLTAETPLTGQVDFNELFAKLDALEK